MQVVDAGYGQIAPAAYPRRASCALVPHHRELVNGRRRPVRSGRPLLLFHLHVDPIEAVPAARREGVPSPAFVAQAVGGGIRIRRGGHVILGDRLPRHAPRAPAGGPPAPAARSEHLDAERLDVLTVVPRERARLTLLPDVADGAARAPSARACAASKVP